MPQHQTRLAYRTMPWPSNAKLFTSAINTFSMGQEKQEDLIDYECNSRMTFDL